MINLNVGCCVLLNCGLVIVRIFLAKKKQKTETHDCDTTLAAVASLGKI